MAEPGPAAEIRVSKPLGRYHVVAEGPGVEPLAYFTDDYPSDLAARGYTHIDVAATNVVTLAEMRAALEGGT